MSEYAVYFLPHPHRGSYSSANVIKAIQHVDECNIGVYSAFKMVAGHGEDPERHW